MSGAVAPAGEVLLSKIYVDPDSPRAHLVHALPQPNLPDETNQWRWRNQDHYLETFEAVLQRSGSNCRRSSARSASPRSGRMDRYSSWASSATRW